MKYFLALFTALFLIAHISVSGVSGLLNLNPTEPTDPADNITFSAITSTSITVSWFSGDGNNRLVIVRAAAAVNQLPIDGQVYTANSDIASAQHLGSGNLVVYNGTSNQVTITGLNPSTSYHVVVIEFNADGITTNYLTAVYASASSPTSGTTAVHASKNMNSLSVYPNPFHEESTLRLPYLLEGEVKIVICDILGNELKTLYYQNVEKLQLNRESLQNGIYFFQLFHQGQLKASGRLNII